MLLTVSPFSLILTHTFEATPSTCVDGSEHIRAASCSLRSRIARVSGNLPLIGTGILWIPVVLSLKYLHTVRESASALSIGTPHILKFMCVFSAGLNDFLCLISLGDRVEEILALQPQGSALTAYRYGAPTGFFLTINFYLVRDTQHQSLLSDHPDTYTTNFNG